MGKQEEFFRRYEKLSKAERPEKFQNRPGCCKRCIYYRPDFKYRRCQFSRCPYGNVILPFVDHFPTDLELYRIMTTKLSEVADAKAV